MQIQGGESEHSDTPTLHRFAYEDQGVLSLKSVNLVEVDLRVSITRLSDELFNCELLSNVHRVVTSLYMTTRSLCPRLHFWLLTPFYVAREPTNTQTHQCSTCITRARRRQADAGTSFDHSHAITDRGFGL